MIQNIQLSTILMITVAGILSFFMRRVPGYILQFIKSNFVVTIDITSANDANRVLSDSILQWFMAMECSKRVRVFILEPNIADRLNRSRTGSEVDKLKKQVVLTLGYTTTFFIYKHKLCWITRIRSNAVVSQTIKISFFTKDSSIAQDFIESIQPVIDKSSAMIYDYDRRRAEWKTISIQKHRELDSVILPSEIKQEFIEEINSFFNSKEWYTQRGIPHKLAFLLHGLPGTGKTSTVFALASYFRKSIYLVNINSVTDETIGSMVRSIPEDSFILMEDIDVCKASDDREAEPVVVQENLSKVSLSSLLNTLDGIGGISSNIVFVTTNHFDKLDPALTRKGRMDHVIEFGLLQDQQIKEFIKYSFSDVIIDENTQYEPIAGCDIQSLLIKHKDSYFEFEKQLKLQLTQNV